MCFPQTFCTSLFLPPCRKTVCYLYASSVCMTARMHMCMHVHTQIGTHHHKVLNWNLELFCANVNIFCAPLPPHTPQPPLLLYLSQATLSSPFDMILLTLHCPNIKLELSRTLKCYSLLFFLPPCLPPAIPP